MEDEVWGSAEIEKHADVVEAFVADFDDVGESSPLLKAELFVELDGPVAVAANAELQGLDPAGGARCRSRLG